MPRDLFTLDFGEDLSPGSKCVHMLSSSLILARVRSCAEEALSVSASGHHCPPWCDCAFLWEYVALALRQAPHFQRRSNDIRTRARRCAVRTSGNSPRQTGQASRRVAPLACQIGRASIDERVAAPLIKVRLQLEGTSKFLVSLACSKHVNTAFSHNTSTPSMPRPPSVILSGPPVLKISLLTNPETSHSEQRHTGRPKCLDAELLFKVVIIDVVTASRHTQHAHPACARPQTAGLLGHLTHMHVLPCAQKAAPKTRNSRWEDSSAVQECECN